MIRTFTLNGNEEPTAEQLKEIEEAARHPIVFDEDCPELSPAMIEAFKASAARRGRRGSQRNAGS